MVLPNYPPALKLPPSYALRPSGMTLPETAIFRAWQLEQQRILTGLMFNVHVGSIPGDNPSDPENVRRLRAALYAKRIDVIGLTPTETWIIEVKQKITGASLGQLLTYLPHFTARFPELPPPRPILLAAFADPDILDLCKSSPVTCQLPPYKELTPLTT